MAEQAFGGGEVIRPMRICLAGQATMEAHAPRTTGAHSEIGEDVKVVGIRRGDEIELTVACS